MFKYKLALLSCAILFFGNINLEVQAAVQAPASVAVPVSPIAVVNNPNKYLNKEITFNADFVSFTSLGLDYKPALRESSKYIGVLIKRSDVSHHVIPLSEMKILVLRKSVEEFVDLEQGDKIKITGKVYSTALGDPWVDVTKFEVLTKKEKKDDKK